MRTGQARPFGLRDKIGYAMGDFGNNFTFLFASMWLLTFGTDVLGLPGCSFAKKAKSPCKKSEKDGSTRPLHFCNNSV